MRSPRLGVALAIFVAVAPCLCATPPATQIGQDLYAYISDNDGSANATFLVGEHGVLVVDTGVDAKEGGKLLQAIRAITPLPVVFIVNTHYHPDHQGGNAVVGPSAEVLSSDYTHERTRELIESSRDFANLHPADLTFSDSVTIHLQPYIAEAHCYGKGHTAGDAVVYFPKQAAVAMGDLLMNRSSPAMDHGSVENWIRTLDSVLQKPLQAAVPGHFELAHKADVQRFRDYLNDLYSQVVVLKRKGVTAEEIGSSIDMKDYRDFRQYPKYDATFADNAREIYEELRTEPKP